MPSTNFLAALTIVLGAALGLSACSSVPEPAPAAAPPPASDKGDDAPETENNPL